MVCARIGVVNSTCFPPQLTYTQKSGFQIDQVYSLIDVKKHKFYHSDYIEKDYLVFERKRIVSLLVKNNVYDRLRSKELVEKCILYNRG